MKTFTEYFRYYWKAFLAFVAPGAVTIGASVHPDSVGGEFITQGEWITALVAAVVTSAAVAVKSNGPNPNAPVTFPGTVVNHYSNLTPQETVKKPYTGEPHILYRGSDDPVNKPAEEIPPRTE